MRFYWKCLMFSLIVISIFLFIDIMNSAKEYNILFLLLLFVLIYVVNFIIWLLIKLMGYLVLMLSALFLRNVPDIVVFFGLFSAVFIVTAFFWKLFGVVYLFSTTAVIIIGFFNVLFYYLFIFRNHQVWLEGF